jgi:DNA-binding beta-propeller fold protein YncE
VSGRKHCALFTATLPGLLLAVFFFASSSPAQTVTATLAMELGPYGVAVNPVTNKIYVGTYYQINVIYGYDHSVEYVSDPNASLSYALAVNPITNKIYSSSLTFTITRNF